MMCIGVLDCPPHAGKAGRYQQDGSLWTLGTAGLKGGLERVLRMGDSSEMLVEGAETQSGVADPINNVAPTE